ncbi:MAG: ATP-binding cassette domain-containing protein, partial [Bdellovibrionales bacterium]|nr:ATP-binding cassette domain-containing protein [Bdellovibrionales bacterium]
QYHIQFSEVSFAYPNTENQALESVSFEIPEGGTVALVGFSGAGKSTIVDLLCRFIDPSSGVIRIGDRDIRTLKLEDLRRMIAMVGQHTFLFNDTIFHNIAYGKPGATEKDVQHAAEVAYASAFIEALPNGYNTKVGEGGYSLSGGERQRLAIARAVLKEAPILVLDEATASLDNQSEREVQAALEALGRERTSIVIAHRLSTVQQADAIVVLDKGRVVEIGDHSTLLSKGGLYNRLYKLQFRDLPDAQPVADIVSTADGSQR